MQTRFVQALALAAAALAGCSSSSKHFPEESRDAEHAIDHAEESGAERHARLTLESARETLANARRAEEAATRDKQAAQKQLEQARARAARADQRLELVARKKQDVEDQKKVQEIALDRMSERANELKAKGLDDAEIHRLLDTDEALARARLRCNEAELASIEKELELVSLEKKDAQLDQDAANARLATADQRLEVSRALFQRAQEQARLAELETEETKRAAAKSRITSAS